MWKVVLANHNLRHVVSDTDLSLAPMAPQQPNANPAMEIKNFTSDEEKWLISDINFQAFGSIWDAHVTRFLSDERSIHSASNVYLEELGLYLAGEFPTPPHEMLGLNTMWLRAMASQVVSLIPHSDPFCPNGLIPIPQLSPTNMICLKLVSLDEVLLRSHQQIFDLWGMLNHIESEASDLITEVLMELPEQYILDYSWLVIDIHYAARQISVIRCKEFVSHVRIATTRYETNGETRVRVEMIPTTLGTVSALQAMEWNPPNWFPDFRLTEDQLQDIPESKNMLFLTWNVKGLSNPAFLDMAKVLKRVFHPTTMILTETWAKFESSAPKLRDLGYTYLKGRSIMSDSGGVLIVYDLKSLDVLDVPFTANEMDLVATDREALGIPLF